MGRERKTLILVALTLIVYAFSIYNQPGGQFIFPYPIHSIIFLLVSIQFTIWKQDNWRNYTGIILIGIIGVFADQFIWEIILSTSELESFSKYYLIDLLKVIYKLGLILWIISDFRFISSRKANRYVLTILSILLIFCNLLTSTIELLFAAYLLAWGNSTITKKGSSYYWMLLVLLTFFELITNICVV